MEYDVPEKVLQILLSHRETEQACSDHSIEVCSCGENQYFGTMPTKIFNGSGDDRFNWRNEQYQLSHDWKYSHHLRTIWNEEIIPLIANSGVSSAHDLIVINECAKSDSGKHLRKESICLWCSEVEE